MVSLEELITALEDAEEAKSLLKEVWLEIDVYTRQPNNLDGKFSKGLMDLLRKRFNFDDSE